MTERSNGPPTLWSELKRRKVVRVAGVYLATALGVIYAADAILPNLLLPQWTVTLVIALVGLGFPIALVLAWVFDRTPDGLERTAEAGPGAARLDVASAGALAVLPFANLSPESDAEYFSDGITDEITHSLGGIEGVRVISRTSAHAFKGANVDVQEIAARLGASTVLEGTVRKAGDQLRITAQLIDASDRSQIWSERFDRTLHDLFAVQDEIAAAIAQRLAGAVLDETGITAADRNETPSAPVARTASIEAYDEILRGRHLINKFGPEQLRGAIEHFARAAEIDPEYPEACSGMAEGYFWLGFWEELAPGDAFPKATELVERALALDPSLPDGLAVRGGIRFAWDWDWEGAERDLRTAFDARPSTAAGTLLGLYYVNVGRIEEGLAHHRERLQTDPLNVTAHQALGYSLSTARAFDESIAQLERTLRLDPDHPQAQWTLGAALLEVNRGSEAVDFFRRSVETSGGGPFFRAGLVTALARTGATADARTELEALAAHAEDRYVSPVHFVWAHLALGDTEKAFDHLARAEEERATMLVCLPSFWWWDAMHGDSRFQGLWKRMRIDAALAGSS